jgi:ferric-dicitrate binding protein FerR (iron transport regulator)
MEKLGELIDKYAKGDCSPEEKALVEQWYQFLDWKNPPEELPLEELEQFKEEVWLSICEKRKGNPPHKTIERNISIARRSVLWRYIAAAVIFAAIAGIGSTVFYFNNKHQASIPTVTQIPVPDIMPGASKAQLLLDDGKVIVLDSAQDTSLTEKDGTTIDQQSGKLIYKGSGHAPGVQVFNTLHVPKGGEYQLVLDDGTKVWMNAASSLRYPTRFITNERLVFLDGEAFFEVAKNKSKPFRVITKDSLKVEALGTRFNIMSYADERSVTAALEEGSVRVSKNRNAVVLTPAHLAEWHRQNNNLRVYEADLEKILAWKNGMIEFREDDLAYIMRQISRWYDVEVSFSGDIPKGRYSGYIRRQSRLSQLLEILKESGVKCRTEGKKLIVE